MSYASFDRLFQTATGEAAAGPMSLTRLRSGPVLLQQQIVFRMRSNQKPVSRIASHVCQCPIAIINTGAPDFADLLEVRRRMRVIATPELACLARPSFHGERQHLINTPESTGRRRLDRAAASFPEQCRRRSPGSGNRAHRILNLARFAGPSRSDAFVLPKPKACRSLISFAYMRRNSIHTHE